MSGPHMGDDQDGGPRAVRLTTADLAHTSDAALNRPDDTAPNRPDDPRNVAEGQGGSKGVQGSGSPAALFPRDDANDLRKRWSEVQASFVDEPRRAVEDADALVAGAMKRLAEMFAAERSSLEGQWDRGGDVSTEDLRVALTRYRSLFDRLLSV